MSCEIDRLAIMRQIRKSLLPNSRANYNKQHWPKWLEDRLTTLAIYGYTDKSECPEKEIQCLKMFSEGLDYKTIAINTKLKPQSVQVYISKALYWIVDNTPDKLLANVPIGQTQYRLKACPHCGGDEMWSDEDGAYWCLSCSRYYNEANQPMIKLAKPNLREN